jgi:hypothetical protein
LSLDHSTKKVLAQNFLTRYDGRPINQMEYRMESIHVSIDSRRRVIVDEHEGGVWMHLYVENGSMYVVLTKAQAQELIAALEQVIA